MLDYNKIKKIHSTLRFNELVDFFYCKNPIYDLNTALIDNDSKKIEINKSKLDLLGHKYMIKSYDYLSVKTKFNIAYLLHHNLAMGGLKILIEQANHLQKKGHNVSLYCHMPKPEWIDISCRYYQVPIDMQLYKFVNHSDIVISGYWDLIIDALKINAPLKYYMAQGDIDIFEYENNEPIFRNITTIAHSLPVKIITVSNLMKRKIQKYYSRKSTLIPNAIDTNIFYPIKNKSNIFPKILLIGNDKLSFKGHNDIIKALIVLKNKGYEFNITWITPINPTKDYANDIEIDYIISPSQKILGDIYRNCDICITGSKYESFSLPPLESMASGIVSISAANKGVKEYAIDNENCLLYEPGNVDQLVEKLILIFDSNTLRQSIIKKGLETAKIYNWSNSISILEKEFRDTAKNLHVAVIENT